MLELECHEGVTCAWARVREKTKVYIFVTDGMLIDTGPPILSDAFLPFLETVDVDRVVLTHSHEDHVGHAAWLQQNRGLPLYIHPLGVAHCTGPADYPLYRQQAWGLRAPFQPQKLGEWVESRQHRWKVLYTPGHAWDHVALVDEERGLAFSGDLYLAPQTRIIRREESIPAMIRSIKLLLSHNFQALYCSHSGYHADGPGVLKKKLDYLEEISGQILDLYRQGLGVEEIRLKLFPKEYPITQISGGDFDTRHIITSVLSAVADADST